MLLSRTINRAAFFLIFLCLPVVQSHSQDGVSREARSGFAVSKPVLTTSGLIHGHPAPNAVDISEYLGIPYAQPPVGELRFSPPVHYRSVGALNGSAFGFMCPQPSSAIQYGTLNLTDNVVDILNGLGALPNEQSEDCLTINVWTKSPGIGRNRPVMLWTHGGGFLTGGSALPVYTGQKWAEDEDVVFMSFNYRMGVFGFPGGPGLTQNVALLDHRMAVEWARNNAAAFGGDPSRITLFGQSAGAALNDFYNYIWRADPIIAGMIGQSGAASSLIVADPETQIQAWYNLTTAVGCGNTTTQSAAKVVACMRDSGQVSAQDLVEATIRLAPGPFDAILGPFRPTIDNETIFSDYARRDRDGLFIRKPVLIGSNDNEGKYITLIFELYGQILSPEMADSFTRNLFTCVTNTVAHARYVHNVPIWRYRYFPSFPNINIPTSMDRAYHLAEVFPLFGTTVELSKAPYVPEELEMGSYMRSAWAAFAHSPEDALSGSSLNWPRYDPNMNTTSLVLLGRDRELADFDARESYDALCN